METLPTASMMKLLRDASLNPPIPATEESSRPGRDLLAVLKSLEKSDYGDVVLLEKVVGALQNIINISSRLGLLQGHVATAQKVLTSSSVKQGGGNPSANLAGGGGRSGKHGRSKDSSKNDLVIHPSGADPGNEDAANGSTATLDVQLILSAITRVLVDLNDTMSSASAPLVVENKVLVVVLASDLCTAICEFVKAQPTLGTCATAEYELMATSGKLILTGLDKTMRSLLADIGKTNGIFRVSSDHEERAHAIKTCLRASASLVGMFGTKLSRATVVLAGLRQVAWDGLTVTDESVVHAAAVLLATLPFTGGTDRTTPSDMWSTSLADSLACLFAVFKAVAPINKKLAGESTTKATFGAKEIIDKWIDHMQTTSLEKDRVDVFLQYMSGLKHLAVCLLDRSTTAAGNRMHLLTAEVDAAAVLDLVEVMLSFPVTSESNYYGIKKRLRLEPVDDGLLSPASIAGDVANRLKVYGHEILDTALNALGGPLLLPYARRVARMSYASLLTSCSGPLRKVLDPTSAVQLDGKKRRWLHSAIAVRTVAIMSLQQVIVTFGVDSTNATGRSAGLSAKSSSDVDRVVAVVGGCLIEQLSTSTISHPESGEWGSYSERIRLTSAAADCLTTYVVTGGEYTSAASRQLVESIASKSLSSIMSIKSGSVASFGDVKAPLLSFGTACVCTPWPDGAASSIVGLLRSAAKANQHEREMHVSNAAALALQSCDTIAFPRVPALQVITRAAAPMKQSTMSDIKSAEAIAESLEGAQAEIVSAKAAAAVADEKKRKQSQDERETERKSKRAKIDAKSVELIAGSELPPRRDTSTMSNGGPDVPDAPRERRSGLRSDKTTAPTKTSEKDEPQKEGQPVPSSAVAALVVEDADIEDLDEEDGDDDFPMPMISDCGPDRNDE